MFSHWDYIGRHEAAPTLADKVDNGLYLASRATKWLLGATLLLTMAGNAVYEPAPPQVGGAQLSPAERLRAAVGANRFASCDLLGIQITEAARYPGDLTRAAVAIRTQLAPEAERSMAGGKNAQATWTEPDFVARQLTTTPGSMPEVTNGGRTHYLDPSSQANSREGFLPAADNTAVQTLGVFVSYSATTVENGIQTTTDAEQYCGSLGRDAASSWQVAAPQPMPVYIREYDGPPK